MDKGNHYIKFALLGGKLRIIKIIVGDNEHFKVMIIKLILSLENFYLFLYILVSLEKFLTIIMR